MIKIVDELRAIRLVKAYLADPDRKAQVERELSSSLDDVSDIRLTWFAAFEGPGTDPVLCGFAATEDTADAVLFRSAYVLPDHRGEGVYTALLTARLVYHWGASIRAYCADATLGMYLKAGFWIGQEGTDPRTGAHWTEVTNF